MAEKYIQEHEELEYKTQLKEFMQQINKKPSLETIEKLKQQYLKARETQSMKG